MALQMLKMTLHVKCPINLKIHAVHAKNKLGWKQHCLKSEDEYNPTLKAAYFMLWEDGH